MLARDPLLRELKLWMRRRSNMWACGIQISPNSLQNFSCATFEKCLKGPEEVHMSLCCQLHCFLALPSGFWETLQSRFHPLFRGREWALEDLWKHTTVCDIYYLFGTNWIYCVRILQIGDFEMSLREVCTCQAWMACKTGFFLLRLWPSVQHFWVFDNPERVWVPCGLVDVWQSHC